MAGQHKHQKETATQALNYQPTAEERTKKWKGMRLRKKTT